MGAGDAKALHEVLWMVDAPDAVTPEDVRHLLGSARAEAPAWAAPGSEAIRAIVADLRRRDDLRRALCLEPAHDGHMLRLYLRPSAPVEVRLELEEMARAAELVLYDPEGPELSRGLRLGRAGLLARALAALTGGVQGYVLVESEQDPAIYVQLLAAGGAVEAEAVATRYLPPGRSLTRVQHARLRLLGWRAPAGDRHNHHRAVALDTVDQRASVEELLVRTLMEVYGLVEGAPLVLHTHCVPVASLRGTTEDGGRFPNPETAV